MSELVTQCGGDIATDGQVLNAVQSYVSVRVPLYVSYVFYAPGAGGGWQHTDLVTQLRLSFVYDTAILWHQGIGTPGTSELSGVLYPTAMRIREDGRLSVDFRTEARFRGTFVESHPASSVKSTVTSEDHPDLTFSLTLVKSQPTYTNPQQNWQFVSDYAVRDYSGLYIVRLLPCTENEDLLYSLPLICNPKDLVSFDLQVRFQQVSDPVAEEFSLNTQFHLTRKRELWLSNSNSNFDSDSDVSFYPGDRIYGRIMIDPVQALGDGFHVTLEKCSICTGIDGYIPKYDPGADEYGCAADSPNLLHNFKIIDKDDPESVRLEYENIGFNARLAEDDPEPDVIRLLNEPGADGFSLDPTPLFQVAQGRQWFIHCIYTVRSEENAARGIGKRDTAIYENKSHSHEKRDELHMVNRRLGDGNPQHKTISNRSIGVMNPMNYSTYNLGGPIHSNVNHEETGHTVNRDVLLRAKTFKKKIRTKRGQVARGLKDKNLSLGQQGRGTNMHKLSLSIHRPKMNAGPGLTQDSNLLPVPLMISVACLVVFLATSLVTAYIIIRKRSLGKDIPPGYKAVAINPDYNITNHLKPNNKHRTKVDEENTEV
ncbi:FRAS1-related extracellular matrix protein 2-like [Palaemon carinicauda]|uniref:FRAS1-related extracellular matrix protein 2-like n=1 Tax=Palaemon carinicauda TaxID=392227 RepID=UPI0035B62102